ncbi:hypothetical protein GDO86_017686 [Hymenochirus boettgeri]|uniref:Uncharacterized protein n=1 Tax=Hymenochirus boettgeri TaxID=247094 RepID=A0A8T2IR27_9PIPI|nr:hypothetical protein GDO86_017686 [Hymenochirus boettgeri]
MSPRKMTVGICSREGKESYMWLKNLVEGQEFQSVVQKVVPIQITNSPVIFTNSVRQCSFAILYHSKNRGRVNITDVTDSLYDEELKHLSSELGKERVFVVVDDMEDISEEKKEDILANQPSIKDHSQGIFLISKQEKEMWVAGNSESMRIKTIKMKEIMANRSKSDKNKTGNNKPKQSDPQGQDVINTQIKEEEPRRQNINQQQNTSQNSWCCCCISME